MKQGAIDILRLKFLFGIFSLFVMISSCAMGVPEKGYDYLAPPMIIDIQQEKKNIIIHFQGYNNEYYFDGYNIYISTTRINEQQISSLQPIKIKESGYSSCIPSYPLSPNDYNPDNVRSATLYHYYVESEGGPVPYPFSDGPYFILLCSHHRLDGVLPEGVSNQMDPIYYIVEDK